MWIIQLISNAYSIYKGKEENYRENIRKREKEKEGGRETDAVIARDAIIFEAERLNVVLTCARNMTYRVSHSCSRFRPGLRSLVNCALKRLDIVDVLISRWGIFH